MMLAQPDNESDALFAGIWADALAKRAELLGQRLDDANVRSPPPKSADALLLEIDRQQKKFTDFREKRQALFRVLDAALKPIEFLGNLAAGAATMAFPPSSLVFGAVLSLIDASPSPRGLQQAGRNVSACYDAIIDLFYEIKEFTARVSVHARQRISQELRGIVTDILLSIITICDLSAIVIKKGRLRNYFNRLFLGEDEKVKAELANLRRLTESEERMVVALTLAETTSTGRAVDGVAGDVKDIQMSMKEGFDKVATLLTSSSDPRKDQTTDNEQQLVKLREHLKISQSSNAHQEIYDRISHKRVSGTGDWIRKEPHYQSWINRKKPVLWISGGPGTGKSFLSSNIIQHLTGDLYPQRLQDPRRISVAYFFFKEDNPELRSFNKALRNLAYQICQNDPVYAKHCSCVFNMAGNVQSTEALWKNLFIEYFKKEGNESSVLLVLDGLDEALDSELDLFLELLEYCQPESIEGASLRMQLAMLGRPEVTEKIEAILRNGFLMISVSTEKTSNDIRNYVSKSVSKTPVLRRVSLEYRQEIIRELNAGADGMFLWVDLMVKEISTKHSKERICQALAKAPRGLSDTIRHVLERYSLFSDDVPYLNEMLAWAACAQRPLTLGELDLVIKLKSSDGEGMLDLEELLRLRYASLFTLTRDDGFNTEDLQAGHIHHVIFEDDNENTLSGGSLAENDLGLDELSVQEVRFVSDPSTTEVHFAHASIAEFFRANAADMTGGVGVDFNKAQVSITKTCMNMSINDQNWEKCNQSSLYRYAASYWPIHLESIQISTLFSEQKREVGLLLIKMVRDLKVVERWCGESLYLREQWAYSNAYISLISRWFQDEDAVSGLDDDDRQWLASVSSDTAITANIIMVHATKWLKDIEWNPVQCFMTVWAYIQRLGSVEKEVDVPKQDPDLNDLEPREVLEVARWAGFVENGLWHIGVAEVLRRGRHLDEAFEQYEVAQTYDDNRWPCLVGLSTCCSKKGDYRKAIQIAGKAVGILEADAGETARYPNGLIYTYTLIGDWSLEVKDSETALQNYRRAFNADKGSIDRALNILKVLGEQANFTAMMNFLEELQADISPQTRASWLIHCSHGRLPLASSEFYDTALRAARETGRLGFLRGVLQKAIREALRTAKIYEAGILQDRLAMLNLTFFDDEEKAIHLWEQILEISSPSRLSSGIVFNRILASNQLAMRYFERALSAQHDTSNRGIYLHKLETLSKPFATVNDDGLYSTREAAILLGKLYQILGQERKAGECFRTHVKLALEMLTDDDPDNDIDAFKKLGFVLAKACDDVNAAAAWSACVNAMKDRSDDDGNIPSDQDYGTGCIVREDQADGGSHAAEIVMGATIFECDGPCDEGLSTQGEAYHMCRMCFDCGFCNECFGLLKSGELPFKICNPQHDFFWLPNKTKRLPKGMVLFKGVQVKLENWLEELRQDWGV